MNWKKLSMLFVLTLLIMIVVVPSIIVKSKSDGVTVDLEQTQQDVPAASIQQEQPNKEDEEYVVEVFRSKQQTIDDVPLEDYVVGVVAYEMKAEFE